ncbi:MAG TPA: MerR family transcriptional regulator [Candidatus Limnocylindrales bacterium]
MYTIKEAANRSGVAVPTIRAWERRYGVIAPARTDSGYRLFDEEAIRRLDAMRRLVAGGMSPALAAAEIAQGGIDMAPAGAPPVATQRDDFVEGAAAMDEQRIAVAIDEMLARGSFERVASDDLLPALQRMGDAWADGRVSVAGEHLASHLVLRRLGQLLDAAGPPARSRGRVLVGLPPGSRHELGALSFAIVARRAGVPVAYLGADIPIEDWVTAARSARAAVMAVPTHKDVPAATDLALRLRTDLPGLIVAAGGSSADEVPLAIHLPDRLDAAVSVLKRELNSR